MQVTSDLDGFNRRATKVRAIARRIANSTNRRIVLHFVDVAERLASLAAPIAIKSALSASGGSAQLET